MNQRNKKIKARAWAKRILIQRHYKEYDAIYNHRLEVLNRLENKNKEILEITKEANIVNSSLDPSKKKKNDENKALLLIK